MKVKVHQRVREYHRTLHPDVRRAVKAALLTLPDGDTKPLAEELHGLHRLRVGEHRFVWRWRKDEIRVFYAAPRRLVYEYLAAHLHELFD